MLERVKGEIEATGHVESRGVTITKRLMEQVTTLIRITQLASEKLWFLWTSQIRYCEAIVSAVNPKHSSKTWSFTVFSYVCKCITDSDPLNKLKFHYISQCRIDLQCDSFWVSSLSPVWISCEHQQKITTRVSEMPEDQL